MGAWGSLKGADIAAIGAAVLIAVILGLFLLRYPSVSREARTNLRPGPDWECLNVAGRSLFCIRKDSPSN